MEEEDLVPTWARELAESIADTIVFGTLASLDCEQFEPEESDWGVDLVKMWPAVMEVQEAGPNDGELVFGIFHKFDLLAVQKIFDFVGNFTFGYEWDGREKITIEGKFQGREVVVIVYFEPEWDDDEEDSE